MSSYEVSSSFPPGSLNSPVGPYLIPPSNVTVNYAEPLAIWISALCAPHTSISTPGVTPGATQASFSLEFAPSQASGDSSFLAKVTVDPSVVYSDDATKRIQMANDFTVFRTQVEALEVTSSAAAQGGLIRGGASLLLNRVATNMPLRFDEILTYLYGFNASLQYVDVLPGMTLRAEWAGYQFCNGPGGLGAGLNGFVNSGTSRFHVTRRPDYTLSLDAFLAQFSVPGYSLTPPSTSPPPPCPLFAAGLIDLNVSVNARRHLRIFFPKTIVDSSNIDNSGTSSQMSSRLIGADTYADIEAATEDIVAGNFGCGVASPGNQPIVSIVFTGRVAVIPEISFFFDGVTTTVPLGTTLRNVLNRVADPAPDQFFNSQSSTMYVKMSRWTQNGGPPTQAGSNNYAQVDISFNQPPASIGPLGDCFDVPLVKGDNVRLPNIIGSA